MSSLAVVDPPAMDGIRKCFLEIERSGSADPNFDELPFVDEEFEVVPSSSCKYLSADGGFEPAAFLGIAD